MADFNGRFLYSGFFTELFAEEIFAVKQDELWTMYIPLNEFVRLNEAGMRTFSDEKLVNKYLAECNKVLDCYYKLCENILHIGEDYRICYRNIVYMYFKIYSLLMAQYRITNMECTSKLKSEDAFVGQLIRIRWNIRKAFMKGNKIFYALVKKATKIENFEAVIQNMTYEDLLNYMDNYETYEPKAINILRCSSKKIEFLDVEDCLASHEVNRFIRKPYLKGNTVSRAAVVRAKVIVLKDGNMNEKAKKLLKKEKCVVVTVSMHFDISEYRNNIVGLVCDEGGVLSHSAIIAREFDLPCITGTICGTMNFSTGDYVELDTFLGIIKHCNPINVEGKTSAAMEKNLYNYLVSANCGDEVELILKKMDADINRELRENGDDYEKLLEDKFIEEMIEGKE